MDSQATEAIRSLDRVNPGTFEMDVKKRGIYALKYICFSLNICSSECGYHSVISCPECFSPGYIAVDHRLSLQVGKITIL